MAVIHEKLFAVSCLGLTRATHDLTDTDACRNQVLDLRKEIAETEMSSAAPKAALQRAIQAKFKEWLVTSGALRQVQDLVHLDQLHGNGTESQRAFPFE
jgi:hypothetical protein